MTPEKQALADEARNLLTGFVEEIEGWSVRYLAATEDVAKRIEEAGFTAGEQLDVANSLAPLLARIEALA